jgi:hypothetical protein
MKIILIVATIFAVIPPCLVLMMKDLHLGDTQNEVEGRAIDGDSMETLTVDAAEAKKAQA